MYLWLSILTFIRVKEFKYKTKHDRDFNVSVNIMFEGLKIYMYAGLNLK